MATTYDKASLVMIPSGVKEDKLYSIKPTDGSGDFTFSRGTDTATRVNASGLIEKERGNLLLQSNTFDTTWYDSGVTETSGNAGYDGTNDAWEITRGGAFNYKAQDVSTSGVQTFSTYAKRSSFDFLLIRFQRTSSSYAGAYFDLTNGVVSSTDGTGVIDSNIESVGSDWYRISITFNESLLRVLYYPVPSDGGVGVGGSGSIFIQDAMLNQGLVAQPYIETTTAAVYEGITDNLPRLDYSGGASCPSLLLEPSRTNIIPNSEYQDAWSVKSNISLITNSATSPEGVQNATNIYPSATGASFLYESLTYTNATTYVFSVFAKANGKDYLQIATSGASWASNVWCTFDLNLVATDNNGFESVGIEDYGNGWYRCYIKETAVSTSLSRLVIGLVNSANAGRLSSVTADGTNGVLIYGVVSEAGSYPTSYIPTYGTSASRAADDVNSLTSVSNLIGQTEGTIFIETSHIDEQAGDVRIQLSVGTSTNNWIFFGVPEATGGDYKARMYINNGGVNQVNRFGSALSSGNHKYALAYKENDVVLYVDGELQASDTLATIPACDRLTINGASPSSSASQAQNKYKQVALFKTRLTNAELATLTTL